MNSDGEDAEELFAEPEESNANNGGDNGTSAENSAAVRVSPPKRTRVVKNPRLKFNPERLCGARGIPVLVDHFKSTKFLGKGHEKEDLDKLMAGLEHWTHRLFPSMKFEECLQQIERLGKKRPVQTCLTKIRMDMRILSADFVKDKEEDNVMRNEDLEPRSDDVDPFDQLVSDRQDSWEPQSQVSSSFVSEQSNLVNAVSTNIGQALGSIMPAKISEEQKQIMERNRLLAIERRKAKLAADANKSNSLETKEQPSTVSFDSLLPSSPANSSLILEKTAIICTSVKETDNPGFGGHNSPVLGADDFSDCCEKMDTSTSFAGMDSTIKIGLDSLNGSSNDLDNVIESVPANCQNSEHINNVELVDKLGTSVSKSRLEDTELLERENVDLVHQQLADSEGGEKGEELSPTNIPDEHLGLESLMELVDED